MNTFLWQTYHRLIAEVNTSVKRFIYPKLDTEHRLTGIVGPRGVGKTTLLLQYIKDNLYDKGNSFYFSADNTYFNESTILDFVDNLYIKHGINIFFIDEIHRYANWNQELKNIYDSFPKVKIVFSGSSSIDLVHGAYDLSRRARILYLPGLSFREFLNIKTGSQFDVIAYDDLINNHMMLASMYSQTITILQYFDEYMKYGYYPFVFENRDQLYQTLSVIIEKTIFEDIANFYTLKTTNLIHFQRILNFLSSIPPGNIKTNNIAKKLQIDNKTVDHYLHILERTQLIKCLYPQAHGNQVLTKPAKVYLDNATLLSALNVFLSEPLNIGTMRELVFLQCVLGAGLSVFYPEKGDFQIGDSVFEVGGRSKTHHQLKDAKNAGFLVKDDILIGSKHEIPLYLFGFLY